MTFYDEWKTTDPHDEELGSNPQTSSAWFYARLAEKDAEIERLKVENETFAKWVTKSNQESLEYERLISELADALDRSDPIQISIQEVADLIERAREATK
jgi:hypothetical protein